MFPDLRHARRSIVLRGLASMAMLLVAVTGAHAQPDRVDDHHALSPTFTAWLTAVAHHVPGTPDSHALQVAALSDKSLVHLFTQLSADEAVHWATLNNAMGTAIPAQAFLFG